VQKFVAALPSGNPAIKGLQPAYSPGDNIEANCTSPRSKPTATLAWYLNGIRVGSWFAILSNVSRFSPGGNF
jgi:CD80-like C2-set immunoglobulin domain